MALPSPLPFQMLGLAVKLGLVRLNENHYYLSSLTLSSSSSSSWFLFLSGNLTLYSPLCCLHTEQTSVWGCTNVLLFCMQTILVCLCMYVCINVSPVFRKVNETSSEARLSPGSRFLTHDSCLIYLACLLIINHS